MKARILVAVVGIPFLLLILAWAPSWATLVLVSAMCVIGAYELMHAVLGERGRSAKDSMVRDALWAALLFSAWPFERDSLIRFWGKRPEWFQDILQRGFSIVALFAMVFITVLFFDAIFYYGKEKQVSFGEVAAAIFAGMVFPTMLSCLLRLRLMDQGQAWVFVPLCISFGSDTFALFAGMLFGKHKLAPHVSPKKTVEGGIGGLLGGVMGMTLFKLITDTMQFTLTSEPSVAAQAGLGLSWTWVIVLGLVGSVISQIGDLSFSVIKREFGVKDYGNLLPGHGGILDRFDSVTFVAPFVWCILSWKMSW